jgi:hypothetical protein
MYYNIGATLCDLSPIFPKFKQEVQNNLGELKSYVMYISQTRGVAPTTFIDMP